MDVRLQGFCRELRRIEGEVDLNLPVDNVEAGTSMRCCVDVCKDAGRSPAKVHDCSERLGFRSRKSWSG